MSPYHLLLATRNPGKITEMQALLGRLPLAGCSQLPKIGGGRDAVLVVERVECENVGIFVLHGVGGTTPPASLATARIKTTRHPSPW